MVPAPNRTNRTVQTVDVQRRLTTSSLVRDVWSLTYRCFLRRIRLMWLTRPPSTDKLSPGSNSWFSSCGVLKESSRHCRVLPLYPALGGIQLRDHLAALVYAGTSYSSCEAWGVECNVWGIMVRITWEEGAPTFIFSQSRSGGILEPLGVQYIQRREQLDWNRMSSAISMTHLLTHRGFSEVVEFSTR